MRAMIGPCPGSSSSCPRPPTGPPTSSPRPRAPRRRGGRRLRGAPGPGRRHGRPGRRRARSTTSSAAVAAIVELDAPRAASTPWSRSTTRAWSSPPRPAARLGLPHNPPDAVAAHPRQGGDARRARRRRGAAARASPWSTTRPTSPRPSPTSGYPCVVKPTGLVRQPRRDPRRRRRRRATAAARARSATIADGPLLVEEYVPGVEVAVEGLLRDGVPRGARGLRQARPARRPVLRGDDLRHAVAPARPRRSARVARADRRRGRRARARRGPGARRGARSTATRRAGCIEVAARSIGGLCARTLRFGAGIALEELILRHALGLPTRRPRRASAPRRA